MVFLSTAANRRLDHLPLAIILLSLALGILLILPHLYDQIWQDEAYTLIKYASKGPLYPFTDYRVPNNHILFSSILSLWWNWGDSLVYTRLLLLLFFALTLATFAYATYRLGGGLTAMLAIALFITNNVTDAFSLQLRGYAPSWLFVSLILLSLPRYIETGKWYWGVLYTTASAVIITILPTNILVNLIFISWGWWNVLQNKKVDSRKKHILLGVIALPPFLGFIAYVGILDQVLALSHSQHSPWTKSALLINFSWSILSDFWFVLPLILIGITIILLRSVKTDTTDSKNERSHTGLLLITIFYIFLFIALLPSTPYPRTLVPLLPLVCYLVAYTASTAITTLFSSEKTILLLSSLLTISTIYYSTTHKSCDTSGAPSPNLCSQYYHQDYQPQRAFSNIINFAHDRFLPVATDDDGLNSLGYLVLNTHRANLILVHYKNWKKQFHQALPPIIVFGQNTDQAKAFQLLGLTRNAYKESSTSSFFKVFVLSNL